jgi:hypothetical protein
MGSKYNWPNIITEQHGFGRPSIDDLAMKFAISAARDQIATLDEIHEQYLRKEEMIRRIGAERTEAAIARAKEILAMVGIGHAR